MNRFYTSATGSQGRLHRVCVITLIAAAVLFSLAGSYLLTQLLQTSTTETHAHYWLFGYTLIVVGLSSYITWLLLQRNTRHTDAGLTALKRLMQLARKGHLELRAPIRGRRSLQGAQAAFNQLTEQFQHSQIQLDQSQQTLLKDTQIKHTILNTLNQEGPNYLNEIRDPLKLVLETQLSQWQRHYLDMALNSVEHLNTAVHDLFELNTISTTRICLQPVDFNLRDCLEDGIAPVTEVAETQEIRLNLSISDTLSRQVHADPGWLQKTVQVLLKTTLCYAHKARQVQTLIHAHEIEPGVTRLSITARVNQASHLEHQGKIQFGWIACQRLVQQLDGQLEIHSQQSGTALMVSVVLPLTQSTLHADSPVRTCNAMQSPCNHPVPSTITARALLVDDQLTRQHTLKTMLIQLGYEVDTASQPPRTRQLFQRNHYDLVLLDCNMPEHNSLQTVEDMRSGYSSNTTTPILAMTSVTHADSLYACLQAGFDDILIKPVTFALLKQRLRPYAAHLSSTQHINYTQGIAETLLARLKHSTDTDTNTQTIIDVYLADSSHYIALLQQAVDQDERTTAIQATKALKICSEQMGALHLAVHCTEMETLARNGQLNDVSGRELLAELQAGHYQVEHYLQQSLNQFLETPVVTPPANQNQETVLVVDDDPTSRLLIERALQAEELNIIEASNGQEAIEMYRQSEPDLILMDALMPIKDGFEACRRINLLSNGNAPPILIITALENDDSVERAFMAGATDFIPKPIHFAVLKQRIKRALEARRSEKKVKQLAYCDNLTGLPNRAAFSDRLQQELAHAKRNHNQLAVMFIDIDHFKDVNDNLGHAAGDELLIKLTQRISTCIRGEDTLARMGGDEFVIALGPACKPEQADTVANKIILELSHPFQISKRDVYVGASIGISIYPEDGKNIEMLLKHADTAMYRAKASGRNNYQFYATEMSETISRRISLETDLRHVLHKGQLRIYFQPKAHALSGTISGAEALIRWQHPKRGFLAPDTFISIAEDAGLMNDISHWVMLNACRAFRDWHLNSHFSGTVAVNVSARQLLDPNFVSTVEACLAASELPAEFLELEITEDMIVDHTEDVIHKLQTLGNMGVKIAIDDFGVGFSSFDYLKRLPATVLKIDKSFVADIPEDDSGAAIVDGMIQLAHRLSMEVVAEGVESSAQYQFLQAHDCDTIQGYWISKPIPPDQFHEQYVKHAAAV